jgi:hypothetical protein
MARSQFTVDEISPSYWRVTFENGPINLLDADSIDELAVLVTRLPDGDELAPGLAAFFATAGRAESAARIDYLAERGFQTPCGAELDMGRAVAEASAAAVP